MDNLIKKYSITSTDYYAYNDHGIFWEYVKFPDWVGNCDKTGLKKDTRFLRFTSIFLVQLNHLFLCPA